MSKRVSVVVSSLVAISVVCWGGAAMAADSDAPDVGYKLQLKFRYWLTDMSAETSEITGLDGKELSLTDEVGMNADDMAEGQILWRISERHSLKLAYTRLSGDSDKIITRAFIFDDSRYAGFSSRLRTDLVLDYGRIGWRYALVNTDEEKFRLETILDAAIFRISADYQVYGFLGINRSTLMDKDDFSFTGGLPLVGLAATWTPVKFLSVFGEFSGMTAGQYGYLFDTEAGLRITPWKYTSLEAGYRYFSVKGHADDEDAEVEIAGPFIGVSVQF